MSIIIRLQNLPWSANALDIRQFFSGLQIPEGGVHIVGGELGDAFIAFSTDEDARQAFLRTDGSIKGIQIKLMLSSRTEMQRVIEQARTQSMAAFMLPAAPIPAPTQQNSWPANSNPSIKQSSMISTPLPAAVPQMLPAAVPEIKRDVAKDKNSDDYSEKKRDRRRSRSKSRDRRDRSRDRRRRDRRSRSKSRDRRDRRRGRSKSRVRSRDRDRNRKDRGRSNERKTDTKKADSPPKKPTDIWVKPIQANIIQPSVIPSLNVDPSFLGSAPWALDQPKSNVVANLAASLQSRKLNGFEPHNNMRDLSFGRDVPNRLNRPMENWPAANPPSVRENFGRINRNVMNQMPMEPPRPLFPSNQLDALYESLENRRDIPSAMENVDLRQELSGRRGRFDPYIENNGAKKSRFENSVPVNACVSLQPFSGSYAHLRRFFNGLHINYRGIKILNDEFGVRTGVTLVQFKDEKNKNKAVEMNGLECNGQQVTIKAISDEVFEQAIDKYNPRMESMNPQSNSLERLRNTKKHLHDPENEISDFCCLKLEGLPSLVKEQDILHVFSQHPLISLHLNIKPKGGSVAYVKFSSKEVAKLALQNDAHHVIQGKPLKVQPCTDEEFNEATQDEVVKEPSSEIEEITSECISMSQLPTKSNDRDISDFFSDIGLIPTKIHLISNSSGFTGQAYCEFDSAEEAAKAASKDNTTMGHNTVSVKLISRETMEGILSNSLPHPGLGPGQTLAPGTPLPPIKPEIISSNDPLEIKNEEQEVKAEQDGVENDEDNEEVQLIQEEDPVTENLNLERPARLHFEAPVRAFDEDPAMLPFNNNFAFNNDMDFNNGRRREPKNPYDRPRFPHVDPREHFNGPRDSYNSPYNGPLRGHFLDRPRGRFDDEPRGRFNPRNDFPEGGRRDFDDPRIIHNRGPPFPNRGPSRFDMAAEEDDGDIEAQPGCTVYLENVPFKAGTNEILDFFRGYNCTNNVSRRYNSDNSPSGEAKVTFYNPDDAFRAVQDLQGMRIWNRPITLSQE